MRSPKIPAPTRGRTCRKPIVARLRYRDKDSGKPRNSSHSCEGPTLSGAPAPSNNPCYSSCLLAHERAPLKGGMSRRPKLSITSIPISLGSRMFRRSLRQSAPANSPSDVQTRVKSAGCRPPPALGPVSCIPSRPSSCLHWPQTAASAKAGPSPRTKSPRPPPAQPWIQRARAGLNRPPRIHGANAAVLAPAATAQSSRSAPPIPG